MLKFRHSRPYPTNKLRLSGLLSLLSIHPFIGGARAPPSTGLGGGGWGPLAPPAPPVPTPLMHIWQFNTHSEGGLGGGVRERTIERLLEVIGNQLAHFN